MVQRRQEGHHLWLQFLYRRGLLFAVSGLFPEKYPSLPVIDELNNIGLD
jgi:hypothetical protein